MIATLANTLRAQQVIEEGLSKPILPINFPPFVVQLKELGVFDGGTVFATGAMGIKLFEVAPYVAMVNIGAQFGGGMAINKKLFDSMPAEVQKVLLEGGKYYGQKFGEVHGCHEKRRCHFDSFFRR